MITKEMTLLDIVAKYPETEKVFHQYDEGVGKCLLCNNLFDSIESLAKEYKINSQEILRKLNNII